MSRSNFFSEQKLKALLQSEDGPIVKDLQRRAIRVETAAKLNATGRRVAGANNPEGRGPRVQTGRLRASITYRIGRDAEGFFFDIGTNVRYAKYLELGLLPNGRSYPFLKPALIAAE